MNINLVPSRWDGDDVDIELDNGTRLIFERYDPDRHPVDLVDGEVRPADGWVFIRQGEQVVVVAPAETLKEAA